MTRTITPISPTPPAVEDPISTAARRGAPGLVGADVPTEPTRDGETAPRRRRSRFPGPSTLAPDHGEGDRPAVRWAGSDGRLRQLVGDHATAVGLELSETPSDRAAVCTVVDASALATASHEPRRRSAPLLVVTDSSAVPGEVWSAALTAGAQAVLPLPDASDDLLSRLAELARPRAAALMLGVVSGCGGAGASSFAARLAAAARRHGAVSLLDADPLGGGMDLLVEAPPQEGIRWPEAAELGPEDGEALREGLPRVDEVHLLVAGEDQGPSEQTLPPVLSALAALGGTVVVDLSPALVAVAAEHLDHLLVVVPSSDHAVRATARRLRAWQLPGGLARVVVRRAGPLTADEVREDLTLPLAGAFRDSPRGAVPLLDVRRGGADRAARTLMATLTAGAPA